MPRRAYLTAAPDPTDASPSPRSRRRILKVSAPRLPTSRPSSPQSCLPPNWPRVRSGYETFLRAQSPEIGEGVVESMGSMLDALIAGCPHGDAQTKHLPRLADKLQRVVGDHPDKVHFIEVVMDHVLASDSKGH